VLSHLKDFEALPYGISTKGDNILFSSFASCLNTVLSKNSNLQVQGMKSTKQVKFTYFPHTILVFSDFLTYLHSFTGQTISHPKYIFRVMFLDFYGLKIVITAGMSNQQSDLQLKNIK